MTITADAQVERTLAALRKARNEVAATAEKPVATEPRLPWREYEDTYEVDRNLLRHTLDELDQQIIEIERAAYRDPVQDAEMRMELQAEMALTGVRDDPALYMHTPHEERLFQERIRHEVDYGYYDPEDGWVDGIYGDRWAGIGNCVTCNRSGIDLEDQWFMIAGHDACDYCADEAVPFMHFLGWLTNTKVDGGRFDNEFMFVYEEDEV